MTPQQDGETVSHSFTIRYTTDDANAASALITSDGGGTITATGSNGVSYSLDIPPNALASDTTVTVTPLLDLFVGGPGKTVCEGCTSPDSLCCVTGALFDPSGLAFDSLVTLTLRFPPAEPLPFDSLAVLIHFDSTRDFSSMIETDIDPIDNTLTARISHFSGYGTSRPDDARLYAMCVNLVGRATAAAGNNPAVLGLIPETIALRNQCLASGYSAAASYLESGFFDAFQLHVQQLSGAALTAPSRTTIESLTWCYEMVVPAAVGISASYHPFYDTLRGGVDQAARLLAQKGKSMCDQDDCDGRDLFAYVFELGNRGYVTDYDFLNQVRQWSNDCCGEFEITLSADKTLIHNSAVLEGALGNAIVTFTATVKTPDGEPIENAFVRYCGGSDLQFKSGYTDASGHHRASWTGSHMTPRSCTEFVTKNIYADARVGQHLAVSEVIPVTIQNIRLFTSVNVEGCLPPWSDVCDGDLTRSYHSSATGWTKDAVDSLTISACKATAYFEGVVDNKTGETVAVLREITVTPLRWMTEDIVVESCNPTEGCSRRHTDLSVGPGWDQLKFPPEGGLIFFNNGGGDFDPYIWSDSYQNENTSWSVDLQIAVGAGFQ
jgi:hypothetical protein